MSSHFSRLSFNYAKYHYKLISKTDFIEQFKQPTLTTFEDKKKTNLTNKKSLILLESWAEYTGSYHIFIHCVTAK